MKWWNVCVKCCCLHFSALLYVLLPTQLTLHYKHRGTEISEHLGSPKADAEMYIRDVLLHRKHCSSCLKPTLLTILRTVVNPPVWVCTLPHSIVCSDSSQSREAAAISTSQIFECVLRACECWTGFPLSRSHLQGWKLNSAPAGSQASFCKAQRSSLHGAFI